MQKPYPSIRIFKSDFWERLTHVHPLTPLLFWSPIIAFLFWRAVNVAELSWSTIFGVGAAGFFTWTLSEYLLHRYLLHMPTDTRFRERLQYILHGLHHADPLDPTRLVFPPVPAFLISATLYTLFRILLGGHLVDAFFAFFLIAYLCYDYIHFSVHHFKPMTNLGKFLKQHHMYHHYVSPEARFGISSPLWDLAFGTMQEQESKSEQPTA